jgi:thiol-disulfide isomerase/thioredoxin
MDPNILPAQKIARMGIEAVTSDANRMAAREALERAKIAKIEVLSWPEVGKAYSFTLTTTDGRKIRSDDLIGKVVVIDCWATWCSPCMALLPELKALYEKWHQQGLEIVGVSLDRDVDAVQRICKSRPNVAPGDRAH